MYSFIRMRINYFGYHHRHHIRASWCTKWSIQTLYMDFDYDLALKNHFSHRHLLGQHDVVCSSNKHFKISMVLRSLFWTTYFLQDKMLFTCASVLKTTEECIMAHCFIGHGTNRLMGFYCLSIFAYIFYNWSRFIIEMHNFIIFISWFLILLSLFKAFHKNKSFIQIDLSIMYSNHILSIFMHHFATTTKNSALVLD